MDPKIRRSFSPSSSASSLLSTLYKPHTHTHVNLSLFSSPLRPTTSPTQPSPRVTKRSLHMFVFLLLLSVASLSTRPPSSPSSSFPSPSLLGVTASPSDSNDNNNNSSSNNNSNNSNNNNSHSSNNNSLSSDSQGGGGGGGGGDRRHSFSPRDGKVGRRKRKKSHRGASSLKDKKTSSSLALPPGSPLSVLLAPASSSSSLRSRRALSERFQKKKGDRQSPSLFKNYVSPSSTHLYQTTEKKNRRIVPSSHPGERNLLSRTPGAGQDKERSAKSARRPGGAGPTTTEENQHIHHRNSNNNTTHGSVTGGGGGVRGGGGGNAVLSQPSSSLPVQVSQADTTQNPSSSSSNHNYQLLLLQQQQAQWEAPQYPKPKPGEWLNGFLSWVATSTALEEDEEDDLDVPASDTSTDYILSLTVTCPRKRIAFRRLYTHFPGSLTASGLLTSLSMGARWLGGPGGSLLHFRLCVEDRASYYLSTFRGYGLSTTPLSGEELEVPLTTYLDSITHDEQSLLVMAARESLGEEFDEWRREGEEREEGGDNHDDSHDSGRRIPPPSIVRPPHNLNNSAGEGQKIPRVLPIIITVDTVLTEEELNALIAGTVTSSSSSKAGGNGGGETGPGTGGDGGGGGGPTDSLAWGGGTRGGGQHPHQRHRGGGSLLRGAGGRKRQGSPSFFLTGGGYNTYDNPTFTSDTSFYPGGGGRPTTTPTGSESSSLDAGLGDLTATWRELIGRTRGTGGGGVGEPGGATVSSMSSPGGGPYRRNVRDLRKKEILLGESSVVYDGSVAPRKRPRRYGWGVGPYRPGRTSNRSRMTGGTGARRNRRTRKAPPSGGLSSAKNEGGDLGDSAPNEKSEREAQGLDDPEGPEGGERRSSTTRSQKNGGGVGWGVVGHSGENEAVNPSEERNAGEESGEDDMEDGVDDGDGDSDVDLFGDHRRRRRGGGGGGDGGEEARQTAREWRKGVYESLLRRREEAPRTGEGTGWLESPDGTLDDPFDLLGSHTLTDGGLLTPGPLQGEDRRIYPWQEQALGDFRRMDYEKSRFRFLYDEDDESHHADVFHGAYGKIDEVDNRRINDDPFKPSRITKGGGEEEEAKSSQDSVFSWLFGDSNQLARRQGEEEEARRGGQETGRGRRSKTGKGEEGKAGTGIKELLPPPTIEVVDPDDPASQKSKSKSAENDITPTPGERGGGGGNFLTNWFSRLW